MRGYANRGWTVISIDYRLARPDRPTWNLAIADVRCALAWTGTNAAALGLDLNRLTISGASAGGSLALAAAYEDSAKRPDPGCGAIVPRVAAVVVKAPLIDVVGSWQHAGELQDLQRHYLTQYIGGPPERYPERYAAVDLRHYIRRQNPPTLILCGTNDPLLPAAAVKDFARRAEAAGSELRLVLFPYSGHDFNTTFGGIANQAVVQIVSQFTIDHAIGPQAPPAATP
jgi:acetyl esterase/lipase